MLIYRNVICYKEAFFFTEYHWNTSSRYTYNANQDNLCTPYNFKASHNLLKVTKLTSADFLFQNRQQYFLQSFRLCHPWFANAIQVREKISKSPYTRCLKLHSKCFSARPLSPIFVTVFFGSICLCIPILLSEQHFESLYVGLTIPRTIPYTRCFLSPQHCPRCRRADWAHH